MRPSSRPARTEPTWLVPSTNSSLTASSGCSSRAAAIIFSLFEEGLVDRLSVFVGSVVIGGRDAPTLSDGDGFVEDFPQLDLERVERVDSGVVLEYDVPA